MAFPVLLSVRNDLRKKHNDVVHSNRVKIIFPSSVLSLPVLNDAVLHLAGLIKLRELVRSPGNRDFEVHLRQADPESYRSVLKEIKSKEIQNMVVDTRPEHMHLFLRGVSTTRHLLSQHDRDHDHDDDDDDHHQ